MNDDELEARAQAAEDSAKGKALYLNLGEILENEYWHGFALGCFIASLAAFLLFTARVKQ